MRSVMQNNSSGQWGKFATYETRKSGKSGSMLHETRNSTKLETPNVWQRLADVFLVSTLTESVLGTCGRLNSWSLRQGESSTCDPSPVGLKAAVKRRVSSGSFH